MVQDEAACPLRILLFLQPSCQRMSHRVEGEVLGGAVVDQLPPNGVPIQRRSVGDRIVNAQSRKHQRGVALGYPLEDALRQRRQGRPLAAPLVSLGALLRLCQFIGCRPDGDLAGAVYRSPLSGKPDIGTDMAAGPSLTPTRHQERNAELPNRERRMIGNLVIT
jgi:hypothetical protein